MRSFESHSPPVENFSQFVNEKLHAHVHVRAS